MNASRNVAICGLFLAAVVTLPLAASSHAATIFFDDFEDGTYVSALQTSG